MDAGLLDLLPVVVSELKLIRDSGGSVVDFEWASANKLAHNAVLPGGGELAGRRWSEFDPDYFDTEPARAAVRAVETGRRQHVISRTRSGMELPFRVIKTIFVPRGETLICCSHEITDVALERDDARDRYSMMRAAFDHAVHGMVLNDHAGKMMYVNSALHTLLGYEPGTLEGEMLTKIMHPDDYDPGVQRGTDLALGRSTSDVRDHRLVSATGEHIVVSSGLSFVKSEVTGLPIFISTAVDVREERRKSEALGDALGRAEQATRLKSEFLANMSHEIRTPLNGVLGMAQVLAHSPLTADQASQVSVILDSGKALMVLLNDILDLSKIEAGHLEVSPVANDLRHNMSGVFKLHEPMAREKGIDFQLFVHPSVPSRLMFDPVRVRQCASNLIANAIKFTAEGKVLVVVSSAPGQGGEHVVTLHVSDTGCGIAPDKIDRVFDSFAQEDGSTTRRFGGTGLGLSITRKLARLMGGDVKAVSQPGKGSVFTLTIKAEACTAVMPETAGPVRPARLRNLQAGLSGYRALIVDDNAINRRVARSFLAIHGMTCTEAQDGNAALEVLAAEAFDVVLMDIHMPGLDGAEAFKRLRMSNSPNRRTPVIALTADSMNGDREKFLAQGFDGYVSKPIDERSLIAAISQTLNVTRPQAVTG
jgi:PAS domain S-box-containing protein